MQTDEVINIPCGTRGGVLISFDKVRPRRERGRDAGMKSARERERERRERGERESDKDADSFCNRRKHEYPIHNMEACM